MLWTGVFVLVGMRKVNFFVGWCWSRNHASI